MTGVPPLQLLGIDQLLTDDERDIQATVREFVDQRVKPYVADWYERGDLDLDLVKEAGSLGLLGMHLEGTAARAPTRSRTDSPAWSWRPGTRGSAAWSRCRDRWPCSRSTTGAARSRNRPGCRTWRPGRSSAASG